MSNSVFYKTRNYKYATTKQSLYLNHIWLWSFQVASVTLHSGCQYLHKAPVMRILFTFSASSRWCSIAKYFFGNLSVQLEAHSCFKILTKQCGFPSPAQENAISLSAFSSEIFHLPQFLYLQHHPPPSQKHWRYSLAAISWCGMWCVTGTCIWHSSFYIYCRAPSSPKKKTKNICS